jgi:hypothetical protein
MDVQLSGKFAPDFTRKLYVSYLLPRHKVNATEELKAVVGIHPFNKLFVGTFAVRFQKHQSQFSLGAEETFLAPFVLARGK